jgi:hypothetical protein
MQFQQRGTYFGAGSQHSGAMNSSLRFAVGISLMFGALAQAQTAGTVTLTANQTSAQGSLVPVLTWSTAPVASGCIASGSWSGTKFASGSETLAKITASKSYTLTCTWNNGSTSLTWTPPTQNSNNTPLTDLTGYKVLYGTTAGALTQQKVISDATAGATTITALPGGTWYFAVRSVNSKQLESDNSNVAQKTIASASAAKTVPITITAGTPPPPTPTLKTVATSGYDVLIRNGVRVLGRVVGTVPIGTRCQSYYKVGTNYYKVDTAAVTVTTTPRSNTIVARCATS